jgi:hypothetical protein
MYVRYRALMFCSHIPSHVDSGTFNFLKTASNVAKCPLVPPHRPCDSELVPLASAKIRSREPEPSDLTLSLKATGMQRKTTRMQS